ncbi:NUDIX domain-containing protein [Actinomadura soli]|nr:NUDIX hydrolase [Actinomadura soli]
MAWIDPATWYAQLPACYLATGMLLTDPQGRVLLVKTHYREDWGLPGGVAEEGEPPHLACRREIGEELGLDRPAGPLLAVDFAAADGDRLRSMIYLIFDGGTLADAPAITVQEDEITAYAFLPPDSAAARMASATAHRLQRALAARRTHHVAYLPS